MMASTRRVLPEEKIFNDFLDRLNAGKDISTDDIIQGLSDIGLLLGEGIPQFNYIGGSLYSVLLPELLTTLQTTLAYSQAPGVGIAWNALDAIFQFVNRKS